MAVTQDPQIQQLMANNPKAQLIASAFMDHVNEHIAPEKRITSITFERDKEIEIQMAERLILATEFYNEVLTQLENK